MSADPDVAVRRARPDDLDFLVGLTDHEEVAPFLAAGRERTPAAIAADIARSEAEPARFGLFVIEADGEPVGTVRFSLANQRSAIADLSQLALHPSARGRGVASRAARQLQRHLIEELGFHRLQLEVYGFNEHALVHAERAGFRREGVRRKAYRRGDGWVDGIIFGLVAEDLEAGD
jgi:aminoglycoside 6'-N-acetyltransferase